MSDLLSSWDEVANLEWSDSKPPKSRVLRVNRIPNEEIVSQLKQNEGVWGILWRFPFDPRNPRCKQLRQTLSTRATNLRKLGATCRVATQNGTCAVWACYFPVDEG